MKSLKNIIPLSLSKITTLVLDVDGVLVNEKKDYIEPILFKQVRLLKSMGMDIVINTTRGPKTWKSFDTQVNNWFGKNATVIFEIGAWAKKKNKTILFTDNASDISTLSNQLQKAITQNIINIQLAAWPYSTKVVRYLKILSKHNHSPIFLKKEADKINQLFTKDSLAKIEPTYEGTFVVKDPQCSKGKVLQQLGLSLENTLAIGDGILDIPMLEVVNIGIFVGQRKVGRANVYVSQKKNIKGTQEILRLLIKAKGGKYE